MDNYIGVYDNVLTNRTCDNIINLFERNKEQQKIQKEGSMSFTEISITEHSAWDEYNKQISNALKLGVAKYANDCNIRPQQWPKTHGWESIRIKRYLPNDVDQFDNHVDVMDYDTARRFLAFFIYLNDVEIGGETRFDMHKPGTFIPYEVRPKRGRLLMFPPTWTYPHTGLKPISGKKYLLHSYCHYG